AAMRLLPGRPADDGGGAAGEHSAPVGRRHRRGDGGQPVPLRHLCPDPVRGARGRADRERGEAAMNPKLRAEILATLDGDLSDAIEPEAPAPSSGLDRRRFLQVVASATGGLLLAAQLPRSARAADAPPPPPPPSLFIHIAPDNRITLTIPKSEMGQGVRTSLALLIAEELDADWGQVQVETAAYDPRYGDQGTGGSGSVYESFDRLRQAGAAMRTMLIGAAAARWKVPAAQLRAEAGQVIHAARGRRASFGELAADAARQPVPASPAL